jgi:hypothetical protein
MLDGATELLASPTLTSIWHRLAHAQSATPAFALKMLVD